MSARKSVARSKRSVATVGSKPTAANAVTAATTVATSTSRTVRSQVTAGTVTITAYTLPTTQVITAAPSVSSTRPPRRRLATPSTSASPAEIKGRPAVRVASSQDSAVTTATAPAPSTQPGTGDPGRGASGCRVENPLAGTARTSPRAAAQPTAAMAGPRQSREEGAAPDPPGGLPPLGGRHLTLAATGTGRWEPGSTGRLPTDGGAAGTAAAPQPACRGRARGGRRRWGKTRRTRLQPTVGQGRIGAPGGLEVRAVQGDLEAPLRAVRGREGVAQRAEDRRVPAVARFGLGGTHHEARVLDRPGGEEGEPVLDLARTPAARRRVRRSPRRPRRPAGAASSGNRRS